METNTHTQCLDNITRQAIDEALQDLITIIGPPLSGTLSAWLRYLETTRPESPQPSWATNTILAWQAAQDSVHKTYNERNKQHFHQAAVTMHQAIHQAIETGPPTTTELRNTSEETNGN